LAEENAEVARRDGTTIADPAGERATGPPTSMPKASAEITPVLPMPPPAPVLPNMLKCPTTTPFAACAVILPPLLMPPANVLVFSTRMPV
jgi:hypothetical protein